MTHQRWRFSCVFAGAGILVLAAPALAGQQAAKPEQPVVVLEPKTMPNVARGKVAAAEGTLQGGEHRFSVQDLDVMQPVAVALHAADPSRPVRMRIVKGEWDQAFRDCVTDAAGRCDVRFRTQGNFGVRVEPTGATPARYTVAAWVGDEIREVPANLLKPAASRSGGRSPVGPGVLAAGAAGVTALGAIAWVMRGRRKERR